MGALSTPGFWVSWMDELFVPPSVSEFLGPLILNPLSSYKPPLLPTTAHNGASSRVHSHSPVQSSPCPDFPDGWELPWTLPVASYPPVARDACTGWGLGWTLSRVDLPPLQWSDFMSHREQELVAVVVLHRESLPYTNAIRETLVGRQITRQKGVVARNCRRYR